MKFNILHENETYYFYFHVNKALSLFLVWCIIPYKILN